MAFRSNGDEWQAWIKLEPKNFGLSRPIFTELSTYALYKTIMGPNSKLSFQLNCVADLGEHCDEVELGAVIEEILGFRLKLIH